jgi:hypothetical protein
MRLAAKGFSRWSLSPRAKLCGNCCEATMDDIRLSTGFASHPKTRKIERRLGAAGCWAFIKLLLWVGDNRPDGNLSGLSDEDLELIVDWTEPTSLVAVLSEVGFLDGDALSRQVHDWRHHQPFVSSKVERIAQAKAAAVARWSKATPEQRAAVGQKLTSARTERAGNVPERAPNVPDAHDEHMDNVPATCGQHVDNVPSTPTPTPTPTPRHSTAEAEALRAKIAAAAALGILQKAFRMLRGEGGDPSEPFGSLAFQEVWLDCFGEYDPQEHDSPGALDLLMERCIQICDRKKITIPPPFFRAKRWEKDGRGSQTLYRERTGHHPAWCACKDCRRERASP